MANDVAAAYVGGTLVSAVKLGANAYTFAADTGGGGTAGDPNILWFDDFNYAVNTPFRSEDFNYSIANPNYASECPSRAYNAFHDGNSNLVLRVQREPAGVTNPAGAVKFFSGVQLATFGLGWGWPAPSNMNKHVWLPPFRYECRWKMPENLPSSGLIAAWLQTTNRSTSQYIHELDCGENGTGSPTSSRNYQHKWLSGNDVLSTTIGTGTVSDWRTNYHTTRCDVYVTGPEYYIDNVLVGTGPVLNSLSGGNDTTGTIGAILHHHLAPSPPLSSFFGGGGTAPSPLPGGINEEWRMLVDWIKVTQL
jgi:hypothetical protein